MALQGIEKIENTEGSNPSLFANNEKGARVAPFSLFEWWIRTRGNQKGRVRQGAGRAAERRRNAAAAQRARGNAPSNPPSPPIATRKTDS